MNLQHLNHQPDYHRLSLNRPYPNLDLEYIGSCTGLGNGPPVAVEHESVIARTVGGSRSFEHRFSSAGNNQPIIGAAVEVQVTSHKLEFGITIWYVSTLLVIW